MNAPQPILSQDTRAPDAGLFADLPEAMLARMRQLEAEDARQRREGTPIPQSLCQVPPETGRLLALLAALAPAGAILEVGTSGGYSTMWLSRAARLKGVRIRTFELRENKIEVARDTFRIAGIENLVDLRVGDALPGLRECRDIAFAFVDHDKTQYLACYEQLVPNLVAGGVLVADNVHSHREVLADFVARATADDRVDAVPVPIGKGLLVCRRR